MKKSTVTFVVGLLLSTLVIYACAATGQLLPATQAATITVAPTASIPEATSTTAAPVFQALPAGEVQGELVDEAGNLFKLTGNGQMMRGVWLCNSKNLPDSFDVEYFEVNGLFFQRYTASGVECVVASIDFMQKDALIFHFYNVKAGQYFMFFEHQFPASGISSLMDANGENIEFGLTADQGINLGQCRIKFP